MEDGHPGQTGHLVVKRVLRVQHRGTEHVVILLQTLWAWLAQGSLLNIGTVVYAPVQSMEVGQLGVSGLTAVSLVPVEKERDPGLAGTQRHNTRVSIAQDTLKKKRHAVMDLVLNVGAGEHGQAGETAVTPVAMGQGSEYDSVVLSPIVSKTVLECPRRWSLVIQLSVQFMEGGHLGQAGLTVRRLVTGALNCGPERVKTPVHLKMATVAQASKRKKGCATLHPAHSGVCGQIGQPAQSLVELEYNLASVAAVRLSVMFSRYLAGESILKSKFVMKPTVQGLMAGPIGPTGRLVSVCPLVLG